MSVSIGGVDRETDDMVWTKGCRNSCILFLCSVQAEIFAVTGWQRTLQ